MLLGCDPMANNFPTSLVSKGLYIPTSDVFNEQLRIEDIWEADPERAIALVTTRELFFNRGKGMLGDDINMIAGRNCTNMIS